MKLLSGYRVIEIGDPAAMFAGKIFGDMGCDVLRISPPAGDPWRRTLPMVPWGDEQVSAMWLAYNTSKRSVAIDVEDRTGRALLDALLDNADMVVVSGAPAWMEQHRLRPADLRGGLPAPRTRLVAVAISPFGLEGPQRDFRGSDLVLQAAGGMLFLNGNEDRPPVRISEETSWAQAGSQATYVATAALLSAQRDGLGESIDLSIQEAILDALIDAIPWWMHEGKRKTRRTHSGYGGLAIPQIWPCKDGYVCYRLSFGKGLGKRSLRLVNWMAEEGMDDGLLEVDWEISTLKLNSEDAESYVARIRRFFLTKTRAELYAVARARHMILFPVSELSDMLTDLQMAERGFFTSMTTPDGKPVRMPGPLFRTGLSEDVDPAPSPAPQPAAHTEAVLAELAGIDVARFAELRAAGVVA